MAWGDKGDRGGVRLGVDGGRRGDDEWAGEDGPFIGDRPGVDGGRVVAAAARGVDIDEECIGDANGLMLGLLLVLDRYFLEELAPMALLIKPTSAFELGTVLLRRSLNAHFT